MSEIEHLQIIEMITDVSVIDLKPPLPEEDYPVGPQPSATVSQNAQHHLIPRAQLDLRDANEKEKPQRLMGNGVFEEGARVQVRSWRHNMAEDVSAIQYRCVDM